MKAKSCGVASEKEKKSEAEMAGDNQDKGLEQVVQ